MSRRSYLLTHPEIHPRLIEAVKAGIPLTHVGSYAGIADRTFWQWLQIGQTALDDTKDGDPDQTPRNVRHYARLARDVSHARAEVLARGVLQVQRAAQGGFVVREVERRLPDGTVEREVQRQPPDWRASQFLLATSFKNAFGRDAEQVEVHVVGEQVGGSGGVDEVALVVAERVAAVVASRVPELEGGVVEAEVVE
jgi:hypothetical protein